MGLYTSTVQNGETGMSVSASKRRETFEVLDGLRGIAAIAVVAMHISDQYGLVYSIPHAYIAVPFFFMLSGIVIAHAYENGIMRNASVLSLLVIRIERLYPLLIMGLAISLAIKSLRFGDVATQETMLMFAAAVMLVPWNGSSIFPLLAPQWSLAIEIWGNLAHRLIVRKLSLRVLMWIIMTGGVAMTFSAFKFGGLNIGWSLPTFLGGIAIFVFCYPCGVMLYRMRTNGQLWKISAPLWLLVATLLVSIIIPTALRTPANGVRDLFFVIAIFPLLLTAALNLKVTGYTEAAARILGKLSYPLYITHYPVAVYLPHLINQTKPSRLVQYLSLPAVLLATIALTFICLSIDTAFRNRLKTIRGNRAVGLPAAAP